MKSSLMIGQALATLMIHSPEMFSPPAPVLWDDRPVKGKRSTLSKKKQLERKKRNQRQKQSRRKNRGK